MPVPALKTARVRIDARGVIRWLQMERDTWDRKGEKIVRRLGEKGLVILREEVPVGATGRLRASCWVEVSKHTAKVGTNMPYDKYVDGEGKTASSPGRYVPAIDKRLVNVSKRNPDIGVHPGSKRTPYSARTAERMKAEAARLIEQAARGT